MPLTNPNFDHPLTVEAADLIARHITSGRMYVRQIDDLIMLCEDGRVTGVCLLPYQMTRRGVMRAVVEIYPQFKANGESSI